MSVVVATVTRVDAIRSHEDAVGAQSVRDATGRSREEWFTLLDAAGAPGWDHPRIARWLATEHGVGVWWCQSVTVGYEQARGLRRPGQRADGSFEANVSRSIGADPDDVRPWLVEPGRRSRWLDDEPEVRSTRARRSVRWRWSDGSRAAVQLTPVRPGVTRVAVQHGGLAAAEQVATAKAAWAQRLATLQRLVGEDGAAS